VHVGDTYGIIVGGKRYEISTYPASDRGDSNWAAARIETNGEIVRVVTSSHFPRGPPSSTPGAHIPFELDERKNAARVVA